ncbi:Protein of unknown function [Lactobacillus helveticus CIRM-BIA 951]|uniref:Uncharacterized protein n=2 Tax=Lactobacillus helveticus TaxID=1587 RepID=U4QLU7_LACHE|nr:Protein of unknown function [Lactobacillus helveticus CIRM-BIA 953]CDI57257.1 Protein of unknown function [Lactobacillus helveticus CIRM-BIA 951]
MSKYNKTAGRSPRAVLKKEQYFKIVFDFGREQGR